MTKKVYAVLLLVSLMLSSSSVFAKTFKTSNIKENFKQELYQRLDRYLRIDTQSDDNSKTFPSTPGQWDLARLLVGELKEIGLKNVELDKYGYVTAELPANTKKKVPTIGFVAHVDTALEVSGKNVKPQLHKNYKGGDIVINKALGVVLSPKESPKLLECIGHDIVTASGDTLLGADDKNGIAIILTAMNYLVKNPQIKHGTIKVAFTPDEEIGKGVDNFDVKKFKAKYAYTVDGGYLGEITDENFNASSLEIKIKGKAYHTGYAKNLMVNANRIAGDIINSWPENMLPETTEKREGFVTFDECNSTIEDATLVGIIRNHDPEKLKYQEDLLRSIVEQKKMKYPKAKISLIITPSYKNMKGILDKHPKVMKNLVSALQSLGIPPEIHPVRGGTDGATLSYMGLPTPDIFSGNENVHSKYEWASLNWMEQSAKVLIQVTQEWVKNP